MSHKYVEVGTLGYALVDDEDYERVSQHRWYYTHSGPYAHEYAANKQGVLMHRFIMGLVTGDPRQVHHWNGDRLDNRKKNSMMPDNILE
jgi:hypothetical protein